MADMPDLGKKVGPLPMGAWIAVVGAGLFIGYRINKSMAAKQTPADQQLVEDGVGTGGGTFLPINPPSSTPVESEPETNMSWQQKAVQWLISHNYDPLVAQNAVGKFLNGQTLSPTESAMLAFVIGALGPPPEGASTPPDSPQPTMPTNLTGTPVKGTGTVMLAWSPVPGATSYEIRWSSTQGPGGPESTVLPQHASMGHDPNYDHTFFVAAINEFGSSGQASVNVPKWNGVQGPPTNPNPPSSPPPAPSPGGSQYTVQKGDTLWAISAKFYRTSARWLSIYNENAGAIEAAARANGKSSSRGPNGTVGWWIYPGTVLRIP
jgi:LysM domain-containing protein